MGLAVTQPKFDQWGMHRSPDGKCSLVFGEESMRLLTESRAFTNSAINAGKVEEGIETAPESDLQRIYSLHPAPLLCRTTSSSSASKTLRVSPPMTTKSFHTTFNVSPERLNRLIRKAARSRSRRVDSRLKH